MRIILILIMNENMISSWLPYKEGVQKKERDEQWVSSETQNIVCS